MTRTQFLTHLSVCLWTAVVFGGCDVATCKQGEDGCVDGRVRDDGSCDVDLVAQGGRCVRPQDRVGGEAGADLPDSCKACEKGLICASDRDECLDFCSAPSKVSGSTKPPERILCGGELKDSSGARHELDFDTVCKNRCLIECRRGEWFCDTPCDPKSCDAPQALERCHAECDKDTSPVACLQTKCNDARATGCLELTAGFCPIGKTAQCAKVLCSNSCGGFVFDGVCDDGDTKSAATASCAFGTDCADCGPRKIEERDVESELLLGSTCAFHEQCVGHEKNFAKSGAFCAPVAKTKDGKRCLKSCSGEADLCPLDTVCTPLMILVDGKPQPFEDGSKVAAKACTPVICDTP